jgi:hypothetical protein
VTNYSKLSCEEGTSEVRLLLPEPKQIPVLEIALLREQKSGSLALV